MEVIGIGFELCEGDVVIWGNFCMFDDGGLIFDCCVGWILILESVLLVEWLWDVFIDGYEVFVEFVKEYWFVVVFCGFGLEGNVKDIDL